ncbi:MAG: SDR family NAD(P)-dependent oxidoreductase [Steroidobacteraceae bacterium]
MTDAPAPAAAAPEVGRGLAIVIGASGGIGSALQAALAAESRWAAVVGFSRATQPAIELTDEASIAAAAAHVAALQIEPRRILVASGVLQGEGAKAEKSWSELNVASLERAFAVNAIGPALVMKHFLPLLPRRAPSVFAVLSARVGSIGDNRLGGWYGYRASKAALNQLVRTASIELRRTRPAAICVALHPGTVRTNLSAAHRTDHLTVRDPPEAAALLLEVIERLGPQHSGLLLDYRGEPLPW